jgi:hypothetical protein
LFKSNDINKSEQIRTIILPQPKKVINNYNGPVFIMPQQTRVIHFLLNQIGSYLSAKLYI